MIKYDDYLKEQFKNPLFQKEWESSEVEYQTIREMIKTRINKPFIPSSLRQKA